MSHTDQKPIRLTFDVLRWGLMLFALLWFCGSPGLWYANQSTMVDAVVHRDQTRVVMPDRPMKKQVQLVYRNQEGQLIQVLADAEEYSAWVQTQSQSLLRLRQQLRDQVQTQFTEGMSAIFSEVQDRIPRLADWYYSYGTSYQLLWEAITSAVAHRGAENLNQAVLADIELLLQRQYATLVLKPEITAVDIQHLCDRVWLSAHHAHVRALAAIEENFQLFVAAHSSILSSPQPLPVIELDWLAQVQKLRVALDMHSTLGAFRGLFLTMTGATVGKALGASLGTALAAQLTLPFVHRAVVMVTGGVIGGVAGPIGATVGLVIGSAAGLATDWALQQGFALLARPQFVQEVQEAVRSTQSQWTEKVLSALSDQMDQQVEETLALLVRF